MYVCCSCTRKYPSLLSLPTISLLVRTPGFSCSLAHNRNAWNRINCKVTYTHAGNREHTKKRYMIHLQKLLLQKVSEKPKSVRLSTKWWPLLRVFEGW